MFKSLKETRYASLPLKDIIDLCAGPRDDQAWEEFIIRVGKPINLTVIRTAALWGNTARPVIEDLIQATYLRLWEGGRHLLRDFAMDHPEAIVGYVKKIAANVAHDHFKHRHSQSSGGDKPHVSMDEFDVEIGNGADGNQDKIVRDIFLTEVDERLMQCLTGPDRDRDRTIFWLYFRQGMSTKEIASLPTLELGTKGVGSVIERLKHLLREQILRTSGSAEGTETETEKQILSQSRMG
jgi:RNA polymerase sigma-70 factor, ECF subfamily